MESALLLDTRYEPSQASLDMDLVRIKSLDLRSRLKGKMQTFNNGRDCFVHTQNVLGIAKSIVNEVKDYLDYEPNLSLVSSIAEAHDLGHTPFRHVGERTLDTLMDHFDHRTFAVFLLDEVYQLELNPQITEGILYHSSNGGELITSIAPTIEATANRAADKIAYNNHDLDEAKQNGIIGELECAQRLGRTAQERIETIIQEITRQTKNEGKLTFNKSDENNVYEDFSQLRKEMNSVYMSLDELNRVKTVRDVFFYLSEQTQNENHAGILTAILTDSEALHISKEKTIPHTFRGIYNSILQTLQQNNLKY